MCDQMVMMGGAGVFVFWLVGTLSGCLKGCEGEEGGRGGRERKKKV